MFHLARASMSALRYIIHGESVERDAVILPLSVDREKSGIYKDVRAGCSSARGGPLPSRVSFVDDAHTDTTRTPSAAHDQGVRCL